MTTTTKRKPARPPTRKETDAAVNRRLRDAGWLDVEGLDELPVDLHKETTYEFELLRYAVRQDPRAKTPAVAERLDQLRRDLREQMADLGLSPSARRSLGITSGGLGAQNRNRSTEDVVLAYRRPAEHMALLHDLVKRGAWDAVGNAIKAQLNTEPEEQEHEEAGTDQAAESGSGGLPTPRSSSSAERRRGFEPLRAIPGGAELPSRQDAPEGA